MAVQPQGLNVPSIIVTGVVGVILTAAVVEGVRAYYYHFLQQEEAAKAAMQGTDPVRRLKDEQLARLKIQSNVKIGDAMQQIVASGGKLPPGMEAKPGEGTQPGQNPPANTPPADPAPATTGPATTRPTTGATR